VTACTLKPAPLAGLVLVLALAGMSGIAVAQQPSQAQVSAIRSACRSDFQAHCSGVQPGGQAALACLQKNAAALSPACQKAVGDVGGSAPAQKQSATPPSAPPAGAPAVPAASGAAPVQPTAVPPAAAPEPADARPAAAPPPARPATAAAPAATAPTAMAPAMAVPPAGSGPPGAVLARLRQACGADYRINCRGVRPGGGEIVACLAANEAVLSPPCRRALAAARQGM
jgi:cysteine rich repeat protein